MSGLLFLSVVATGVAGGAPAIHAARIAGPDIALAAIVFGMGGAILFPLVRALSRRLEGGADRQSPITAEVAGRLERMERGIEAMALEIERISEGQRFVTKLLAERSDAGRLPPVQH